MIPGTATTCRRSLLDCGIGWTVSVYAARRSFARIRDDEG
jgi:hypothetical protein